MREICLDANIIVKLPLKGEPFRAKARALIKECGTQKIAIIAPPLLESEVDSIIARRVFEGKLSKTEARKIYAALDKMPVRIQTAPHLRRRARELALQLASSHSMQAFSYRRSAFGLRLNVSTCSRSHTGAKSCTSAS